MGMAVVLSTESPEAVRFIFAPEPTPGSLSKKYSSWVIGPAVDEVAEVMKKALDSVCDQRLDIRVRT